MQCTGGSKITRRAFTRKSGVHVKRTRVRDMGAPGKWTSKHGPGIGELKPGGLMGYSTTLSRTTRRQKIRKAVKKAGPLKTFRRLQALSTYTKRTAPTKSRTAKTDRNWVKKTFM